MPVKKRYGYGGLYVQNVVFIFAQSCRFYIETFKKTIKYILTCLRFVTSRVASLVGSCYQNVLFLETGIPNRDECEWLQNDITMKINT